MISLIMAANETFGDHTDVQRLARQLLNKTIGEKMISKQEAMVLVGQLRLVHCSESIDTVSISGYYKLDKNYSSTTFLKKYATRHPEDRHLTVHQYFHKKKIRHLFLPLHKQNTYLIMLVQVHSLCTHHLLHLQDQPYCYILPGNNSSMTNKTL